MKRKRRQSPPASQEVPEVIYQDFKLLVHSLCKILSLGKDVLHFYSNPSH
jgi:hypothetical protein